MGSIALVTFTSSHFAFGLRSLDGYLRFKGHRVRVVHAFHTEKNQYSLLTAGQLDQLSGLVQGFDVVGVSLISIHSLARARQVCEHLRGSFRGDVILGGAPVVMTPDLFLDFADYVCLGEGENLLHGFLTSADRTSLPNLGYRDPQGGKHCNALAPLFDVDLLPVPDLDLKEIYILSESECFELAQRPEFFREECLDKGYRLMMTRGCPFRCTFCCNNAFNTRYRGLGKTVRKRATALVLEELERARQAVPGLDKVYFLDDDIMSVPLAEFRAFMERYGREVGLPIWELSSTFTSLSKEKLDAIRDSDIAVDHIRFGLQGASERMNREVYERPFNGPSIIGKIATCLEYGHRVNLDMILDNPYERLDDLCRNVEFFMALGARLGGDPLGGKVSLNVFHLKFYPGTELYRRALADGIIDGDYVEKVLLTSHYNELKNITVSSFLVFVYYMAMRKRYGWLCRLCTKRPFLVLIRGLLGLPFAGRAGLVFRKLVSWVRRAA